MHKSQSVTLQVMELKNKCDAVEKRETEKRQLEEKKHQEELQALKKTNQQLKVFIKSHKNCDHCHYLATGSIGRNNCSSKKVNQV